MTLIKKSTARTVLVGPVLDADGAAKIDEVVASMKITKNGAVGAPDGAATLTHDHAGKYKLALTANDTDTLGVLEVSLNSGTNDMPMRSFNVVPAVVFDALVTGSDNLQVDLTAVLNTTLTETAGGYLAAAFKKLLDVATPVLTAANVNQTGDAFARVGEAGANLTALGDSRLAKLDANVSSRAVAGDAMALTSAYDAAKTAAQAAVCTETRLAELDAGNLPLDVDTILLDVEVDGVVVAAGSKSGYSLTAAYDAAKTAAQAEVCSEARLAELDAANLPSNVDAILAHTGTDGVVVAAGSKTDYALAAAYDAAKTAAQAGDAMTVANALLGLANAIETGLTYKEALQIGLGMMGGDISGAGTGTEVAKGLDGLTTRVTATVDEHGNRTMAYNV